MEKLCLWINAGFIIIFLILYAISYKGRKRYLRLSKREHALKFLYPISELTLRLIKVKGSRKGREEKQRELDVYRQTAFIILILLVSQLFSMAAILSEGINTQKNSSEVERPIFGSGTEEHLFHVYGYGEGFEVNYDISFEVNEMQPSEEELSLYLSNALDYACEAVLGNNESKDNVTESLNFIDSIPGMQIEVEWKLDNYSFFERDGERNSEDVPESGEEAELICTVLYKDHEACRSMKIRVMPKVLSTQEELLLKLKEELLRLEEEGKERLFLPDRIGDVYLEWSEEKESKYIIFMLFGILLALLVPILCKKENEKQKKKRDLQMQMDYPYIIDKFLLLLTAGMTIRSAWERIVNDYVKISSVLKAKKKSVKRYAYEEMLYTKNELSAGVPERAAYEEFGKQCGLLPYLRFSTLITQNLKKGTRGILPLLELEAKNAFADRKLAARKLGEEAGTKLLLPMAGFLVIVMLLVLIPALQLI